MTKGNLMAGRVLSTPEAKDAIKALEQIINGGLTDQITQLNTQGQKLSQPDVWDGPLAETFRGTTWPETKAALDKAKTELDELKMQLEKISQNIMTAGGGS